MDNRKVGFWIGLLLNPFCGGFLTLLAPLQLPPKGSHVKAEDYSDFELRQGMARGAVMSGMFFFPTVLVLALIT